MNTDTTTPTLAELAAEIGAVTLPEPYTPSVTLSVRIRDSWERAGSVTWYDGRWHAQSGGYAVNGQHDDQTMQQAANALVAHHAAKQAEVDIEAEVRAEILRRRAEAQS